MYRFSSSQASIAAIAPDTKRTRIIEVPSEYGRTAPHTIIVVIVAIISSSNDSVVWQQR